MIGWPVAAYFYLDTILSTSFPGGRAGTARHALESSDGVPSALEHLGDRETSAVAKPHRLSGAEESAPSLWPRQAVNRLSVDFE